MNQQYKNYGAGTLLGTAPQSPTLPIECSDPSAAALGDDTICIENIAALVCEMLGASVKPRLQRKLRDWPHVLEDADDLGQLAALAFVEAFRQGRIEPDPETKQHTTSSVSAYLWGICNHIFIDTLRRNRQTNGERDVAQLETSNRSQESSPLQWLLSETPDDDDESRLWEVLAAVRNRCQPQDIVMTYLLGCGFSSGEIRHLLQVSINLPANAVKRVGQAVRELLGLDATTRPEDTRTRQRNLRSRNSGAKQQSAMEDDPSSLSTLSLLMKKSFAAVVQRLDSSAVRNSFLREAVAAIGPSASVAVEQSLADRRYEMRADGDWSWGLLSAAERRELLLRDARMLLGAGVPDKGAAQRAALKKLVAELSNIFQELDQALLGDDLDWLLPLAEHLHELLGIICEFKEMRKRYRALLEAARRLGSQRLEMTARLGLGIALRRLSENLKAKEELERAAEIARELNDSRGTVKALYQLGCIAWKMNNHDLAIELHQQSLSLYRAIGDRNGEANSLAGLALIHGSSGEYDKSEKLHSQALEIRREIGDRHGEAHSLGNLAVIHGQLKNQQRSAELYTQCMTLCRQLGNRLGEALSLNGLAILHTEQREFDAASEKFSKVISILREIGDRESEAYVLWCMADAYKDQKRHGRAAELLRQARDIYIATGNKYDEARMLCDLGEYHIMKSDLEVARDFYRQSLSIFVECGDDYGIYTACLHASVCLALLGQFRKAAISSYGAMPYALESKPRFGMSDDYETINSQTLQRLEAAIDSGEITAEDLAAWRAEGEALNLDDLAQYVLAALSQL